MSIYSTEQLIDRWEHQREIKNTMGKYVNEIMLNNDAVIFEKFWSKREDVCLGMNDGWYVGAEAVRGFYSDSAAYIKGASHILADIFPEQTAKLSEEEKNGLGTFRVNPLIAPVVEVAGDEQTAKAIWYCAGSQALIKDCGPTASWTWGFYLADFVWEDDEWKIWHLQKLLDVDCTCGKSWGKVNEPYPAREEFKGLKDLPIPEPNKPEQLREYYSPNRKFAAAPPIPEPYETFADTYSYGI
ncbi:MAG: nuclear transport factor 2 family protein [Agathobacter sp.]